MTSMTIAQPAPQRDTLRHSTELSTQRPAESAAPRIEQETPSEDKAEAEAQRRREYAPLNGNRPFSLMRR